MKKLTKLTALALALALMLGMTAFAEAGILIQYDDFSDANGSIDTFKSRSTQSANFLDDTSAALTGAAGRYYWDSDSKLTIETIGGKTALRDSNAAGTNTKRQVSWLFDQAWTYNKDYALVASIDHIHLGGNEGATTQDHVGEHASSRALAGAVITKDGADVNSGRISGDYLTGSAYEITERPLKIAGSSMYTPILDRVAKGSVTTLSLVARPYSMYTEHELDNAEYVSQTSLSIIAMADGKFRADDYCILPAPNDLTTQVTAFKGFYSSSSKWQIKAYQNFRVYKVSLDPADFVVDSAATVKTDIPVDSSLDVVLSHPVSRNGNDSETGAATASIDLINSIVVSDGTKTLEQGTDYEVKISDIVDTSANTVKGVISIVPKTAWDYSTTYTVGLPTGLKNIARISMPDTTADEATVAEVSFTTTPPVTFTMTLSAYEGLKEGTAATELEGTVYFKATAVQSAGVTLNNGVVAIAIYEGDTIVKYATTKKAFGVSPVEFGASFQLEAGQTAKAFVVGTEGVAVK